MERERSVEVRLRRLVMGRDRRRLAGALKEVGLFCRIGGHRERLLEEAYGLFV